MLIKWEPHRESEEMPCQNGSMFITYAQSSLNKWNWNPKRHFLYSLCLVHNGVCNYEMIQSVKPAFEPQHNSIKQVVTLTVIFQGLKNDGTMTMHYIQHSKVTFISRDMVYYQRWLTLRKLFDFSNSLLNLSPDLYPPEEKMFRLVFGTFFLRI